MEYSTANQTKYSRTRFFFERFAYKILLVVTTDIKGVSEGNLVFHRKKLLQPRSFARPAR
jgi:hypothetical protein